MLYCIRCGQLTDYIETENTGSCVDAALYMWRRFRGFDSNMNPESITQVHRDKVITARSLQEKIDAEG